MKVRYYCKLLMKFTICTYTYFALSNKDFVLIPMMNPIDKPLLLISQHISIINIEQLNSKFYSLICSTAWLWNDLLAHVFPSSFILDPLKILLSSSTQKGPPHNISKDHIGSEGNNFTHGLLRGVTLKKSRNLAIYLSFRQKNL